jgi:hypothetical protein
VILMIYMSAIIHIMQSTTDALRSDVPGGYDDEFQWQQINAETMFLHEADALLCPPIQEIYGLAGRIFIIKVHTLYMCHVHRLTPSHCSDPDGRAFEDRQC